MIPQRVYLRGFLSYHDEQEVRFDGSSLWMLSGLNGSGKSSVFDAVTYALFGHHRGGGQQAHELINKDSDRRRRRVRLHPGRRAVPRPPHPAARRQGRRAAAPSRSCAGSPARRRPCRSPSRTPAGSTEFDKWVREHIGLNFETFTSSVLLLQGKAEKLLDSTAKGRFEVLAGIVDLERYQKLHEKADGQRKAFKARGEVLTNQLEALPEVSALEVAVAENRIADAEEQRQQAAAEVERWQGLEFQAKRWGDLQTKLVGLRQKWQQAQALVAEAEAIEKDMARLRELREALPHVETARQAEAAGPAGGDEERRRWRSERQDFDGKIAERTQAARAGAAKARGPAARRSRRRRDAAAGGRRPSCTELATVLERAARSTSGSKQTLRACRRRNWRGCRPTRHGGSEAAQRRCDELAARGARRVPLLERLHAQREGLKQALAAEAPSRRRSRRSRPAARSCRRRTRSCKKRSRARPRRPAQQADAGPGGGAGRCSSSCRRTGTNSPSWKGRKLCRQCGQPLTPGHFEEEKATRENGDRPRRGAQRQGRDGAAAALKGEQAPRRSESQALTTQLEAAREDPRAHAPAPKQARQDVERCRDECGRACERPARAVPLARRRRRRPPTGSATAYPTRRRPGGGAARGGGLDGGPAARCARPQERQRAVAGVASARRRPRRQR